MQKLPVLAVASRVYQFLFRDFGTVVRLSWFPLLIVAIVQYLALRAGFDAIRSAIAAGGTARASGANIFSIVSNLVQVVGTAIVAVALHRVILFGDRKPGRFLYVAFGKTELLFVLLPVLAIIGIFLVALLAGFAEAMIKLPAAILFALVATAIIAATYLTVRFSLLFPIIVLRGRYDFGEAWKMTRGNFWRLVGLWLVVSVPLSVVFIAVDWMFVPRPVLNQPGNSRNAAATLDVMSSWLLAQSILLFPLSLLFGALIVATLSYSYKALSGHGPDDILTPQA